MRALKALLADKEFAKFGKFASGTIFAFLNCFEAFQGFESLSQPNLTLSKPRPWHVNVIISNDYLISLSLDRRLGCPFLKFRSGSSEKALAQTPMRQLQIVILLPGSSSREPL